jgi:hypothetical protein
MTEIENAGESERAEGVTAQFEGECGDCGAGIAPGDQIAQTVDGWCHLDCVWIGPGRIDDGRSALPARAHRFTATSTDDMGY